MRKIVLVAVLWSITLFGLAQNRTTSQSGDWDQTATWGGQTVPDQTSGPFGTVTINHTVTVRASVYTVSTPLQIDQVVIGSTGSLIIEAGAHFRLQNPGTGNDLIINAGGTWTINGILYTNSGVQFSGLTNLNTSYSSTAELHASSTNIPTAAGYDLIPVFIENVTTGITLGASWSQMTATTDLEVNCPSLGNNAIGFNGTITNLRTLQLTSTNGASGGRVVLASPGANTTVTINIGTGGLTVSNDSRIFISSGTSATSVVNLNLDGPFDFNPSVSGASGFSQVATNAGVTNVNFNNGDFTMGSGDLRFSPGGNNAVATFNFNSNSNMVVSGGTISELGNGSARGILNFQGIATEQTLNIATSSIGTGTINLTVNKSSGNLNITNNNTYTTTTITNGDVNLVNGNSFTTTTFELNGGALSLNGASFTITTGNITGGAGIIDASIASSMSIGTGTSTGTLLFSDNSIFTTFSIGRALSIANSPTASSDIQVSNFSIGGLVTKVSGTLTLVNNGSITATAGSFSGTLVTLGVYDLTYNNTSAITTGAELSSSSTAIRNFTKQGSAALTLNKNLTINGTYSHTAGTLNAGPSSPYAFSVTYNGASNTIGATENLGALIVNGPLVQSTATTTTITGNITIGASGSLSFTAGTTTFATGGNTAISNSGGSPVRFNNLTISGTLTAPSGTMQVSGSVSGNGTFNHNNGLVEFIGSTTITQAVKTYFNVTVNNGATLQGATGITIANNLTNNGTITLTGGTITFSGSGQLTTSAGSPSTSFFNLTINAGQTLTISNFSNTIAIGSNLTLNGNLNHTATNTITIGANQAGTTGTLTSNGTIQFNGATSAFAGTATKAFTNLTVNTGAVLTTGANASYSVDGVLSVLGTLNAGTGTATVTFGNAGAGTTPSISGTGTISINNLTIAASHTLTSSSGTINITGNFTNNGSFLHNNGTVLFSTAGTKTISGNSITFNNLTVGNGTGSTTVTNSVNPLNIVGVININSTIVNTLNTNGNVVLLSTNDDTTQDASIGNLGTGANAVINGNITVNRFMSREYGSNSPNFDNGRIYRYLSSPISNGTVSQLQDDFYVTGSFVGAHNGSTPNCTGCTSSPSLFSYNAATNTFDAFTGSALLVGTGYSAFIRNNLIPPSGGAANQPVVVDFSGTINRGTITLNLHDDGSADSWNLVGNPYPSAIVWNNASPGSVNISAAAAVKDNGGGGGLQPINPGSIIAAGQAFWVRTTGASPVLEFTESMKTSSQGTFYREQTIENDEMLVKLTRMDNKSDVFAVRLVEQSSQSFDSFDAPNIKNPSNELINNYIDIAILSNDNKKLLTNSLPSISCNQSFVVSVEDLLENGATDLTQATFTISSEIFGAMKGLNWTLRDNYTNQTANLSNATYQFTVSAAEPQSFSVNRFSLSATGNTINTEVNLSGASQVCSDAEAIVTLGNSQLGVLYGVEINGVYYPNLAQGTGSNLSLFLASDLLSQQINTIKIKGNSGCDSQFLTTTLSIQKVTNTLPEANAVNLCKPSSTNLIVTNAISGLTYNWYDNLNSSVKISSGDIFQTPVLNSSKVYYVAAVNTAGCETARVPVIVNLDDPSSGVQIVASANSGCAGSSLTLTATGAVSSYNWYGGVTETIPLAQGDLLEIPSIQNATTYYVAGVNEAGCEGSRVPHTISVPAYNPNFILSTDKTIYCLNSSANIEAIGPSTGSYQWFLSETATVPVAGGKFYTMDKITNDQTLWVSHVSESGCISPRKSVSLNVDSSNPSLNLSYQASKVCNQGSSLIELTGGAQAIDFNWYTKETDSSPFGQGKKMQVDNLSTTTHYWVAAVNELGCEGNRINVTTEVHKYPEAFITQESGKLISNYTSGNQWYLNGELIPGATANQLDIIKGGTYGLQVEGIQGCQSYTEKLISVITGVEKSWLTVYPNPSTGGDIYFEYWGSDVVQSARLLDMRGALVQDFALTAESNKITGKSTIRELEKGLYILRVVTDKKVVAQKVMVE